jgi:hypothetical protein
VAARLRGRHYGMETETCCLKQEAEHPEPRSEVARNEPILRLAISGLSSGDRYENIGGGAAKGIGSARSGIHVRILLTKQSLPMMH